MKSMKQRASKRLWDIIAAREIPVPMKAVSSTPKEYSSKEYVSPAVRRADKVAKGIPVNWLDPPARRTRAKLLRYNRQTGVVPIA